MLLPIYLLTITIMGPDEGQFVTLNGLTGMAQGGPDDAQNAVATNGLIGAIERRIGDTAGTYTWDEVPAPVPTPAWNYRNVRDNGGYEPSTPYGQSLSEQLGMASRQDFNNLKDDFNRLKDENVELRRQISNLQSMVLNLDGLISEVKQILRFRYVNNDNDR